MKKLLKVICAVILTVVVAVAIIWQGEIRTIASIKRLAENDPYLYIADYKASYDLDKVLAAGIDENTKLVEFVIGQLSRGLYKPDLSEKQVGNGFACTSFQVENANGDGYHYLVADAQGNCAAIEFDLFDGWKTMITRKPDSTNFMLMTNHLLASKYFTTEPDPVLGNPRHPVEQRLRPVGPDAQFA